MERLTRRDSVGQALLAPEWEEKYKVQELIDILLECLATYEDTGLEPEEVAKLRRETISIKKELDGYTKAKREGRLVVLPCKVGDIVWAFWDVPTSPRYVIYCAEVKEITIGKKHFESDISVLLEPVDFRGRRKEYGEDDIGKTVFLAREEAEATLKERGGT